jgi:hypothetical protein
VKRRRQSAKEAIHQALNDLHEQLPLFYSDIGRPSIDPALLIRKLSDIVPVPHRRRRIYPPRNLIALTMPRTGRGSFAFAFLCRGSFIF